MTTFRLYIKVLLVAATLITACKRTLEVNPTHLVPENQMWTTKNDARSAVFETYGLFRAALADNNAYFAYGELRAGDFKSVSRSDLNAVASNQLNATGASLEGWKNWRRFYSAIAQANLCLEKLALVHQRDFRYTEEEMKLDIANVRFMRALTYFYLVRIWGDVPLITSTGDGNFKPVKRESQDKVLTQATQDALAASTSLPWNYANDSTEVQEPYWGQQGTHWNGLIASKGAAYTLLAHIAAWQGDYLTAEKYAHTVINNKSRSGYSFVNAATLTSDGGPFTGQGADIILALPFNSAYQESSGNGHIEDWTLSEPYISRATPDIYVPHDTILRIFNEAKDSRFNVTAGEGAAGNYFTNFGNPLPMFTKIKQPGMSGTDPLRMFQSAIIIFRYEELVLLRAEALMFLGKNEDAILQLNGVRGQRGLADYTPTVGNLAYAILQERRRELLGEGWRWYDLVRFEKLGVYLGLKPTDIAQGAQWWPVSQEVLSSGREIIQNKFWQQ